MYIEERIRGKVPVPISLDRYWVDTCYTANLQLAGPCYHAPLCANFGRVHGSDNLMHRSHTIKNDSANLINMGCADMIVKGYLSRHIPLPLSSIASLRLYEYFIRMSLSPNPLYHSVSNSPSVENLSESGNEVASGWFCSSTAKTVLICPIRFK